MPIRSLMTKNPSLVAYIGCMTGTSADKNADFSIALFEEDTLLEHSNDCVTIPEHLRLQLLQLSVTDIATISAEHRSNSEFEFTQFLAHAFKTVIKRHKLDDFSSERIVLSPHGQTIDHRAALSLTDQLIHGEQLSYETGYPVVFRHRQACIPISQAAPLAPVFLRTLPREKNVTQLFINGGGVANICIISPDQSIEAFDTGPANGPIDSLIHYILDQHHDIIPAHLYAEIAETRYDVGGKLAESGQCCDDLKQALLTHPYFQSKNKNRSLDRADFDKGWLFSQNSALPLLDQFTTLCMAVVDSIVKGIINTLPYSDDPCTVWLSGGIAHNTLLSRQLMKQLNKHYNVSLADWSSVHLNPNHIESLLMAYLGMCVHQKKCVDLSYCLRPQATQHSVIPGIITHMDQTA